MQTKGLSTLVAVVASLVILFMSNAHGQGVRAVQMWEYKSLVYATPAVGSAILYEDGKQTSGTPISKAPDLGAQGWEMVSMAAVATGPSGGNVQFIYWFKRPK